jgi:hypothetical protein
MLLSFFFHLSAKEETMAIAQPNETYEVSTDSIKLFGLHGSRTKENWIIGLPVSAESQSYILVTVSPTSALDDVLALIQQDVADGHYVDGETVALGARTAVILFLEGVLKSEHFDTAEEGLLDVDGKTFNYVRLPSVPFGEHSFPVYIFSEWEVGSSFMATWDATTM